VPYIARLQAGAVHAEQKTAWKGLAECRRDGGTQGNHAERAKSRGVASGDCGQFLVEHGCLLDGERFVPIQATFAGKSYHRA
jgi:hypothetical protein